MNEPRAIDPAGEREDREATTKNRPIQAQFRGVYRQPRWRHWQATAHVGGRRIYLGSFDNALAAACARDYALDGNKARLTFAGKPPLTRVEVERARSHGSKRQTSSSKFRGVSWIAGAQTHPWRARLVHGGHCQQLGCFESEAAAAIAYDHMAKSEFGDKAKLNFPTTTSKQAARWRAK